MKAHELRSALKRFPTVREKIAYIEGLENAEKNHFALYTLASLHLENGDFERAEAILRVDLQSDRDIYQRYESFSLLAGMYMDWGKDIREDEVRRFLADFEMMKSYARGELFGIESAIKRESSGGTGIDESEELKHLLELKKQYEAYLKDPYQFERMIGDYYHRKGEFDRAYSFYARYYEDLDKPVQTFVPDSMRRYVDTLIKKEKITEALYFLGYIINLKPSMFDDLFAFADLYYRSRDAVSAVLILMFINVLAAGCSAEHSKGSRALIQKICGEMEGFPVSSELRKLAEVFLSGSQIQYMPPVIDSLKKEGVRNFFFSYLEGISFFEAGDYSKALQKLTEFNEIYQFLAEAHYYAMVCMRKLDLEQYSGAIVSEAEKVIELKPGSPLAEMTKIYLGRMLKLSDKESAKLLISSEIGSILNGFLFQNAPKKSLDRLLGSLTIKENPYQIALIHLMSRVDRRKDELVTYLKNVYDLLNEQGRKNVMKILTAMGESVPRA